MPSSIVVHYDAIYSTERVAHCLTMHNIAVICSAACCSTE